MRKIIVLFVIVLSFTLTACQPNAHTIREDIFNIYHDQTSIIEEDISMNSDVYYSGFSSYTVANDDQVTLFLLKEDIYSEMILDFGKEISNDIEIDKIKVKYYHFDSNIYYSIETSDENLVLSSDSYSKVINDFSELRIEDIQWILEELGYEVD
ncbi:hypothetical protein KHQ88_03250 [Mycoplasmatota bacterium]|nr:hypothetical protein KHQ88_03250 [Mycoplasmatota bacterium]